jgi:hypothetical protein
MQLSGESKKGNTDMRAQRKARGKTSKPRRIKIGNNSGWRQDEQRQEREKA